jgi:hypothetical protein
MSAIVPDLVNCLERIIFIAAERLRRLTEATIKQCLRGGYPSRRRCLLV